jgi:hypothetical protein
VQKGSAIPLKPTMRLAVLLLLASCATAPKSPHTEAIQSHVYPFSLDDVLGETTRLLVQKGWQVERAGDQLGTNWRSDGQGSVLGYRVEGERIDDTHCSIRIEALAATGFAPPRGGSPSGGSNLGATPNSGRDSSAGNSASGGKSTGWDGVDAPTTLGEPPPGMVTLPRGREEALEYALVQRLEPRAAQAIAHADARSQSAATLGTADGGSALSFESASGAQSPAGCAPAPTGLQVPLAERRVVLVADIPGTNEIPAFVGRLACQAARAGVPTVVALALLRVDQEWVDTYLASQGTPEDRAAFLQVTHSFGARGSGTQAVLSLLDLLRSLRDLGLALRVVAFDAPGAGAGRGQAWASVLERVRLTEPESLLLAVVERSQGRTVLGPDETPATAPAGWYLGHWGLKPLALDVRTPGGQAWSCTTAGRGGCEAVSVPATAPAPASALNAIELYASPDAFGFAGNYVIGPLTASAAPAR